MTPALSSGETAYHRPATAAEAYELLDEHGHGAKIAAGGQSLMLLLRQNLIDPEAIVDISDVPAFAGIEVADDEVAVGATTTYDELESHRLATRYAALEDCVSVIADPQVRNMGTVGGAVSHADPSLDLVPVLLALDARVRVGSVDGTRSVDLAEFVWGFMETDLEPSEVVEAVTFDRPPASTGTAYEKHSNVKGGWATVGVAATVTLTDDGRFEDVRVALAAVDDTAVRAHDVEEALAGAPADEETVTDSAAAVREDIDPLDDLSGSRSYKRALAETLTKRAITAAADRAGETK